MKKEKEQKPKPQKRFPIRAIRYDNGQMIDTDGRVCPIKIGKQRFQFGEQSGSRTNY